MATTPTTYTSIHATGDPIAFEPVVLNATDVPLLAVYIGGLLGPAVLILNESNAEALINAIRTGLVDLADALHQLEQAS